MRRFALSALVLSTQLAAQTPAAYKAIREADIRRDMEAMAGDALRGREAGTIDEMRASVWVADEMEKIGLAPMGDMGSWFQWWNMRRTRISSISSSVRVNGQPLKLWADITPTTNTAADVAGQTFFLADAQDTSVDVRGKVVVTRLVPPNPA